MRDNEWWVKDDGHRYVKQYIFMISFKMERVPDDDGVCVMHPMPDNCRWRNHDAPCLRPALEKLSMCIP